MALYTKYRPKKFGEVVGQQAVVQTLKNSLIRESVGHAYMFTGSRGVGKTSLARILAKTVNCEMVINGEPCLSCNTCVAFAKETFLDCIEIDAASNTGVDNIRTLIEHIGFRPTQGKKKVYIIDEVHMLSKGAFNALLKTLEEPPEHALFILATTEIHKVPATIISRTQRFDFGRLPDQEIVDLLNFVVKEEKAEVEQEVLPLIAELANGGLRDALTRLEKVLSHGTKLKLEEAQKILGVTDEGNHKELLSLILAANTKGLPEYFDKLVENSIDLEVFAKDLLEFLRKQLISSLHGTNKSLTAADCILLSRLFLRAYKEMEYSPSQDLPLLISSIEACARFVPKTDKVEQVVNTPVAQSKPKVVVPPAVEAVTTTVKEPLDLSSFVRETKAVIVENNGEEELVTGRDIPEAEVKLFWDKILEKVRQKNGPLGTLVKNFPLLEVQRNTAIVGVKYLFHKEQLESAKNKTLLNQVATEVAGSPLSIAPRIVKVETVSVDAPNALDALQVFGGEIIDS